VIEPVLAVDGFQVAELVIAGVLAVLGIRSLVKWLRVPFRAETAGESVLYALHVTARVGMWFAFAGFFAGYALVDDAKSFRWYVLVPLALAGIQLLTSLALGLGSPADRSPPSSPDDGTTPQG
jgi:hypothetical protein